MNIPIGMILSTCRFCGTREGYLHFPDCYIADDNKLTHSIRAARLIKGYTKANPNKHPVMALVEWRRVSLEKVA